MKINYIKKVNTESEYGYEIKGVELCCDDIKYDLTNNLINMTEHNPYEHRDYYLGLVNGNNRKLVKFCPHCGKPIVLNKLDDEDEVCDDTYWDEFYPYDFDKGQRFYNCKHEK